VKPLSVKASCLSLVVLLCGIGVSAQQAPSVFRSGIDLVTLNVVVTDGQERFISGLDADDFLVFEDGVPQDVSFFAATAVPIDLAILLDTSASMSDKLTTVQEAAIGFASSVRPGDRLTIVDVKDTVRVLHPLDEDVEAAKVAIRATTARGGTAVYNSLYMTLREIVRHRRNNGEVRREAIVLLSDGDDTASLVDFDSVMEVAKQSGVAIYTITLKSEFAVRQAQASGHRYFSEGEFGMKALAQETGGKAFAPSQISELAGVYGVIAQELASQYALAYTPKNPRGDGAYRRINVRVSHPGTRTRTRAGYLGARQSQAQTYRER
jgi:Ca-activated chloride channel homolog